LIRRLQGFFYPKYIHSMLDTLLKIGEWQSEGASEWDRFLDTPKVETEDKKGNAIKNYILPIIFDLDEMAVLVKAENLREYDEERDISFFKVLKTQGGNNKAIYCATLYNKLNQIYKTFFGKEGNQKAREGELAEAIRKDFPNYSESQLSNILERIFLLKKKFLDLSVDHDLPDSKQKVDPKILTKDIELAKNERFVLLYASVKANEYGIDEPKAFAEIDDYVSLLKDKFIGTDEKNAKLKGEEKLCYASGNMEENVDAISLSNRYSLNKMFVTETRNYASLFRKDLFNLNYQVSKENQEKLDYASSFLLQNYKTRIASLDHVIIPQFLSNEDFDLSITLDGIKKKSDILFSFDALEDMVDDIRIENDNIFWINFIAFESDGNFFKSTEVIKDVSKFHFQKVIETFSEVHWQFKDNSSFVNWASVMTEYGVEKRFFNFNSVYSLIPLRKDKEKRNIALDLFKTILENRKVNIHQLYKHFGELILCHYFERYNSYTNVPKSSKDYFGKAVRDSVFKYLAFFQVLSKLQLIDMETDNQNAVVAEQSSNRYDEAIESFFIKMKLNQNQKAMFFLGRMLNTIVWIQKGKNKTAIDKVNFHGMDRDDIVRLRVDLFEKAKQYGKTQKIIFSDASFSEHFDFEQWNMDSNEAVFFLLTGFSFGVRSGTVTNEQESIDEQ
jgi:CRISPR-associated protein Csh1